MLGGRRGPGRQTLMHPRPSSTPSCRSCSLCCSAWHLQLSQWHASCLSLWSCPWCIGSLALPEGQPHLGSHTFPSALQCYIGYKVMLPVLMLALFRLLQLGLCNDIVRGCLCGMGACLPCSACYWCSTCVASRKSEVQAKRF